MTKVATRKDRVKGPYISRGARGLNFGLSLHLHPYFVNASRKRFGESRLRLLCSTNLMCWLIWASSQENLSSPVASLDMILFRKPITKALIRLHRCAGWSVPVLFANPRRQVFSHQGPYRVVNSFHSFNYTHCSVLNRHCV